MHPQACKDPDNCTLSYVDHLRGFGLAATAIPTRLVNKTEGQPDEPLTQALTREKRWERDIAAYKRLHKQGLRPPRVDGSRHRERTAETSYDINERPVTVDYQDAR